MVGDNLNVGKFLDGIEEARLPQLALAEPRLKRKRTTLPLPARSFPVAHRPFLHRDGCWSIRC